MAKPGATKTNDVDSQAGESSSTPKVKKPRRPSVFYKPGQLPTEAVAGNGNPDNPADLAIKINQGVIRFPGLELENNYGDLVIKIRSKAAFYKNVTLRQLVQILDQEFPTPTE